MRHVSGEARTALERVIEVSHKLGDFLTGWMK